MRDRRVSNGDVQREQILTIEDDPAIRRGIVDALRFAGYETAGGGRRRRGPGDGPRARSSTCCCWTWCCPGRDGFEILQRGPPRCGPRCR